MTLHTCPLTPTQPPPDFQPPTNFRGYKDNGWYEGELHQRRGMFSCCYTQFQYSRELIRIQCKCRLCVLVNMIVMQHSAVTVVSWKSTHPWNSAHALKQCPCTSCFWPNFLYRVKVYSNEHPPWGERLRRAHSNAMHIWSKKLRIILHRRLLLQGIALLRQMPLVH